MKSVQVENKSAFISEDGLKISFISADIVEYELNKTVEDLFENYSVYGTVTFDTKTELNDFLQSNSEQILNFYKNINII